MENPQLHDPVDVARRLGRRDRLVGGVSLLGQVTTWAAIAATGVTTGLLAHAAQVQDRLTAQALARRQLAQPPAVVPVVVRQRPVRTVVVRVPAKARFLAQGSTTVAPRVTRRSTSTVTRTTITSTKATAPAPTKQAPATTTRGS